MKRFRLRTLMLWVAIAGLILGLFTQQVQHARSMRVMERLAAEMRAERARSQAEVMQWQAISAAQEAQIKALQQQVAAQQGPANSESPSSPPRPGIERSDGPSDHFGSPRHASSR
jgi:hypothetical protein